MECNQTVISGEIARLGVLRYTLTGVPAIDCIVRHRSRQHEAEVPRQVRCELPVVALGEPATLLAALNNGDTVRVTGFLNRKNQTDPQLVLHVHHVIHI